MRINFFAEFPEHDFEKLDLIDFPSTIFIASKTLEKYDKYEAIAKKKGFEVAWWPLAPYSYFISPLMLRWEFRKLKTELLKYRGEKILIDLEPPYGHLEKLYTQMIYDFSQRHKIKKLCKMLNGANVKVYAAEFLLRRWPILSKIWGFSYNFSEMEHTKIIMYYTSMLKEVYLRWFPKHLENLVKKYPGKIQVALGILAQGVEVGAGLESRARKNAKEITPENLERDLKFCKKIGIKEVTLYRLGGLNEPYLKVIKKFI